MHYYKINVSDWQAATRHLTPEEEGVYIRLINHYYDTEKPIPLDTQPVTRRLMLSGHNEIVASILSEFFEKTERGYVKSKCEELIKEYKKNVAKNKKNGAKGGRPKKGAASSVTQSVTSGNPKETQSEPKHNPKQELETKKHKPRTIFNPPIPQAVSDYMVERGISFNQSKTESEKFVDFYSSKGWLVGKTKMKDWKAAVRNWTKNVKAESSNDIFNDTSWIDGGNGFNNPVAQSDDNFFVSDQTGVAELGSGGTLCLDGGVQTPNDDLHD